MNSDEIIAGVCILLNCQSNFYQKKLFFVNFQFVFVNLRPIYGPDLS